MNAWIGCLPFAASSFCSALYTHLLRRSRCSRRLLLGMPPKADPLRGYPVGAVPDAGTWTSEHINKALPTLESRLAAAAVIAQQRPDSSVRQYRNALEASADPALADADLDLLLVDLIGNERRGPIREHNPDGWRGKVEALREWHQAVMDSGGEFLITLAARGNTDSAASLVSTDPETGKRYPALPFSLVCLSCLSTSPE